jgi:K+-sensing histidine kinase KdpD
VGANRCQSSQSSHHQSVDQVSRVERGNSKLLRLTQQLSAIKFTQTEKVRRITVRCGASRSLPDMVDGVVFTHESGESIQARSTTDDGVYLLVSVQDSGSGLSKSQQDMLFNRFSQAFAPRTHSKVCCFIHSCFRRGLTISYSMAAADLVSSFPDRCLSCKVAR